MTKKFVADDFIEMDNHIVQGRCPACGKVYEDCEEGDICPDCDTELEIITAADGLLCECCGNEIEEDETYYKHIKDAGRILCSDCYSDLTFDEDDEE